MKDELMLVSPSEEYWPELMAYKKEFLLSGEIMDGCGPLKRHDNMEEYFEMVKRYLNPETLPEGAVVATHFLCVRKADKKIVGIIQVRHYFNEFLEKYAGHIAYSVRPSERLKGYASWMLKNIKPFCRSINLDRILVCCLEDNIGSKKTIIKNGGKYDKTVYYEEQNWKIERYWINLQEGNKTDGEEI